MAASATRDASPALVWLSLGVVYVVWGSTYLGIRVVVETMPPMLTGGVRFLTAGVLMYAFVAWRRGRDAVRFTRAELLSATLIGTALVTGGNGIVMVAEQDAPSGLAALIMASIPLWIVLFRALTGERIAGGTLLGVGVGFAGVAILVAPGGEEGNGGMVPLVLLVLAAFFWSLGTFFTARARLPQDLFASTALQMLMGGVTSLVVGAALGELPDVELSRFSTDSWLALLYLIFIGSIVAFTAFVWVLHHAPISKVSTYAYVNPVIAVFLGWLILSEKLTPEIVIGAIVIVSSVAVTVRRESGGAPPAAGADAPAESDRAAA